MQPLHLQPLPPGKTRQALATRFLRRQYLLRHLGRPAPPHPAQAGQLSAPPPRLHAHLRRHLPV